jgi:hypothetical protein
MKIFILIMAVVFTIPGFSTAALINPARINLIDGDVMFRTPDSDEWLHASVNTPLDEGDALWAPEGSKTEVQLGDGSIVRLDEGSQLDLLAIENGFTHLHLASGKLYLRSSKNAGKNSLQIDADDTTILPDARTRLRIDILPDSQEDVAIFKGSAYVEGNGSRTKVRAGEHIALEEGHSELLPLNSPDSWEMWNSERDKVQSRAASAESNLPDELHAFSGELDSHGSWERVPEYGMVWRPTVVISDNWAPYQSGRWIWKGNDYVWISYESWGWAPYHYGRWAVVSGFGWCWVQPVRGDIYWGPGYVGWYRTESHVGWTPLAPGETFYGHRNYGRHSVNVANNSVSSATIVYKNRNAHGGFSLLLQNDFLNGRAQFQKPPNNTAVSISVSLGSPRIQPIRETRMPIVRHTPPRVVPAIIKHQDRNSLKTRFPRLMPDNDKQHRPQPAIVTSSHIRPAEPAKPPVQTIPRQKAEVENRSNRSHAPETINRGHNSSGNLSEKRNIPAADHKPVPPAQAVKQREFKQKKVWKVTTTDQGEKDQKDNKEHKGKK